MAREDRRKGRSTCAASVGRRCPRSGLHSSCSLLSANDGALDALLSRHGFPSLSCNEQTVAATATLLSTIHLCVCMHHSVTPYVHMSSKQPVRTSYCHLHARHLPSTHGIPIYCPCIALHLCRDRLYGCRLLGRVRLQGFSTATTDRVSTKRFTKQKKEEFLR